MKQAAVAVILLLSSVSSAKITPEKPREPLFKDDINVNTKNNDHLRVLLDEPNVLKGGRVNLKKEGEDDEEMVKFFNEWNGTFVDDEEFGDNGHDTFKSGSTSYEKRSASTSPDQDDHDKGQDPDRETIEKLMSATRIYSNDSDESSTSSIQDDFRDSGRERTKSKFLSRRLSSTVSKLLSQNDFIHGLRVAGELPPQHKPKIYDDLDEQAMAISLYSEKDSKIETINIPDLMLPGKLLSYFGSDVREEMHTDLVKELNTKNFEAHMRKLQQHLIMKKKDELIASGRINPKSSNDLFVEYDYLDFASIKNSTDSFVTGLLGKGSTIPFEKIRYIGEFYDHTLFTARDYVYYPGLAKLAAFFVVEFDYNRADRFFHQFVKSAYSGVYGPRREDLKFITRIEDLPLGISLDDLTHSVESVEAPVNPNIGRSTFVNPDNLETIMQYFPDVKYQPLTSVPKTLDDVLDATEIILETFRWKGGMSTDRETEKVFKEIYSNQNVAHLQNFFLDIASVEDCLELMKLIPSNMYHNHYAAFLYAAYLQFKDYSIEESKEDDLSFDAIKIIMEEMLDLNIPVSSLDRTRKASKKDCEKFDKSVMAIQKKMKKRKSDPTSRFTIWNRENK